MMRHSQTRTCAFIRRAAHGCPFGLGNPGLKDEVGAEIDTPNLLCIRVVALVNSIRSGIEDVIAGGGEEVSVYAWEPGHGQGNGCEERKNGLHPLVASLREVKKKKKKIVQECSSNSHT